MKDKYGAMRFAVRKGGGKAAGLSPFAPDLAAFKAGRLMLEAMVDYVKRGESFAFETTLSCLTYARMTPVWRSSGYLVKLIFLSLPNVEIALERVAARVARRPQCRGGGCAAALCCGHRKF